jgi:hypothetical protein
MSPVFAAELQASTKMGASVLVWATAGGIAVFVGLILEKAAEWMNERFLGETHNPHKLLGDVGWIILMVGIGIEVVVAGGTAIEDWRIKQLTIENSPLNQPISDISVVVKIKLGGTNFVESPNWGSHWIAGLTLCDLKDAITGETLFGATGIDGGNLKADTSDIRRVYYSDLISPHQEAHGYVIRFDSQGTDLIPYIPVTRATPQKVKSIIDKVKILEIDLKFIPHNSDFLGGDAKVLVNGNVQLDFDILPQKAFPHFPGLGDSPGDSGFTMIATNATLKLLPSWMR